MSIPGIHEPRSLGLKREQMDQAKLFTLSEGILRPEVSYLISTIRRKDITIGTKQIDPYNLIQISNKGFSPKFSVIIPMLG